MENKEKLFIYGTLADSKIQQKVLGRMIQGVTNSLVGYKKSKVVIEGEFYPAIILDKTSEVDGLVIEVTTNELRLLDAYETGAYKRTKINLKNGILAWVYIKA